MTGTLYIDACIRRDTSRTEYLAGELISALGDTDVETIILESAGIPPLNTDMLDRRDAFIASDDFSDPMFDHAKRFKDADTIVIAAPYWELSFPSTLKAYFENISVPRLTYRYDENGIPRGLCRARLFYVTTRGGPTTDDEDLGISIIRGLCRMYGIEDMRVLSASSLDIVGNDVDAILSDAVSRIPGIIS